MMNTVGYHSNGRNFPSSNNVIDVLRDGEILQYPPVNNANEGENANLAKYYEYSISLGLENKANPSSEPLDHKPKPWKAQHFPMSSIQIGDYMVRGIHKAHLVGKCFYGKKKLAWEILDGALKNKMEISWPYICGMRVSMPPNFPGILEFELSQPPKFFGEDDPRPRKHTIWKPSSDFTGGHATKNRIHVVQFPAGVLNKYCDKLVRSSAEFLKMMQRPFPTSQSPYFGFYSYQATTHFSTYPSTHTSFPSNNTPISPDLPNSPSLQSHQFCNAIPMSSLASNYASTVTPLGSFSPQQLEQFPTASMTCEGINGPVSSTPVMGFPSPLNEGIYNLVSPDQPVQQQLGHNAVAVIPYTPNQGLSNHLLQQYDNAVPMHQGINIINPISSVSDEIIDEQRPQPAQVRFHIPARLGIEDEPNSLGSGDHFFEQVGFLGIDDPNSLGSGILYSGSEAVNNQIVDKDSAKTTKSKEGNEDCVIMEGHRDPDDIFEGLTLEEGDPTSLFEPWNMDGFFDGFNLDSFVMKD